MASIKNDYGEEKNAWTDCETHSQTHKQTHIHELTSSGHAQI